MADTNIKILADREDIVAIADAVRNKTGASGEMTLGGIASGINNISTGVALPTLNNEGIASELFADKELIDGEGNVITGTFTIDSELTTQDNLITQIQTALQTKAAGSEPVLQSKTVTPSTSSQTVKPDSGYDGLSQVTVNAMTTATQATPTVSIDSAGKITATATQTAGYVAAGTKMGTKQMTTQAAKTITPSTSSQTAVAKNVYTTGVVTVGAIPSTYVKPTTTKSATTYTPTTSNQTIAAGTYCSGAQTIKGDANLKAENIAEGVSIFGVTGTHSGGSSGGGVETCAGRVAYDDLMGGSTATVYYTGSDLNVSQFSASGMSTECVAVKGSLLYIAASAEPDIIENATLIANTANCMLFSIDADEFRIMLILM